MSYANRKQMSSNRTAAIIIVALIHVALGYALVSGLAYNVVKKAAEDLKTFDVEDEPPPPPEEPPPPPEQNTPPPPQVVAPPPIVRTNTAPPPIVSTPVAPPPVITPRAAPAPPAPPANRPPTVKARCEPCTLPVGQQSTVTADANDPDGDTLTYRWSAPSGTFGNASERQTTFTCPAQPGAVPVTVTVRMGPP